LAIRIFFSTAANVGGVDDRAPNAYSPPGWTVEHVTVTGSTNRDLLAMAADRPDRSVLVTDHQTAGKGRLDRRWDAPPGTNLLVSILFHVVPAQPIELTRRVALAAIAACRDVAAADVVLKWPNDLLLAGRKLAGNVSPDVGRKLAGNVSPDAGRKLAGILAERSAGGDVVVGLGLNVGWCPDGAARLGDGIAPRDVLRSLLAAYDRLPADVAPAYRAALSTLGQRVRVELPSGTAEGTAIDVDGDGRLVVVDACGMTQRYAVGDVVHLRAGVVP
jgi:BirA family transcriptional regulator, biotin operon repressor / biotin---[acetyl-CoA-carboxylase] ligase